jgi:hypothetical protein
MYGMGMPGMMGPGMVAPVPFVPQAFKKRVAFDSRGTLLRNVIDHLRDLSEANIYVDQQALKKAEVAFDAPVNMQLKDVSVATVLELIVDGLSDALGVRYEDGIAIIGTRSGPALAQRFPWGNDGSLPSQQTEKRLASSPATYEFIETPLSEVLGFVSDAVQVKVHLNRRALGERDISADAPVSISLKDVKHRTALRLILDSVDKSLFFSVVDGVVVVSALETRQHFAAGASG